MALTIDIGGRRRRWAGPLLAGLAALGLLLLGATAWAWGGALALGVGALLLPGDEDRGTRTWGTGGRHGRR
jgi:hypothetical protein